MRLSFEDAFLASSGEVAANRNSTGQGEAVVTDWLENWVEGARQASCLQVHVPTGWAELSLSARAKDPHVFFFLSFPPGDAGSRQQQAGQVGSDECGIFSSNVHAGLLRRS